MLLKKIIAITKDQESFYQINNQLRSGNKQINIISNIEGY